MSKIITSISSKSSKLGFLFLPYNETIGMPVFGSVELIIFSPASKFPRKPCSGAKTFFTLTFVLLSDILATYLNPRLREKGSMN